MSKTFKVISYILIGIFVLLIAAHFGINYLIKHQLPQIIKEKNDSSYDLTYEDMNFSVFNNSLNLEKAKITPKKNSDIKKDVDLFGEIGEISVTGVNFYQLLKDKKLNAFTISIKKPNLTILKPVKKDTLEKKPEFAKSINIDRIMVENGNISYMSSNADTLFHQVYNMNIELSGIHMGEYTKKKKIPFTYKDYEIQIDSIYSMVNTESFLKSGKIDVTKENIDVDDIRMYPIVSSSEFRKKQTQTNTRVKLSIPKVKLRDTDWGYAQNQFFVKVGGIGIDSIDFHVTDQKKQTVMQQAKKDAEKIVQPLIPFQLDIDSLTIKRSDFKSLAILDVRNVNITLKKISNRVKEKLTVDEFILRNPRFIHSPRKTANKGGNSEPSKIRDEFLFKKIKVVNANYLLNNKAGKPTLWVDNFNLSLQDVFVSDETVENNVPFTYRNPQMTSGKVKYDTHKTYMLYSNGVIVDDTNITLKDFEMKGKISREQHARSLKWGQDYYTIKSGPIQVKNYTWGFDAANDGFFKAKQLVLNQTNTTIFRDASVPNEPKTNHLFSKKLRDLDFNFFVNQLKLNNATLVYQETGDIKRPPGKLTFHKFILTANNIYSGYKRVSGPTTNIAVNTVFMRNSMLNAKWNFNIMNRSEAFNISGNIKDFDAVAMAPFISPYLNVKVTGKIDYMQFNFHGNNHIANGVYAMDFKDMNVKLLKEDGEEKKLLSAIANMVVRTNSKGMKEVDIKPVERIKENSFFNFLWKCILQGLKQTLI